MLMNSSSDGRYFYVVSNNRERGAVLHKLDPENQGASVWRHDFEERTWGAASLANGLLVVPNNAVLYVMNADTGAVLKRFDTGGTVAGGAATIAAGKILVKSGMVYSDLTVKLNDQLICYGLPDGVEAAGTGAAGGPGPAPVVANFGAIYRDVIVAGGCNAGQCHSGPAAGGLSLRSRDVSYENLVGIRAMGRGGGPTGALDCADSGLLRVAPGDPDVSLLVHKLEHTQRCGGPMPTSSTRLSAAHLQSVREWIAAGAPNDG